MGVDNGEQRMILRFSLALALMVAGAGLARADSLDLVKATGSIKLGYRLDAPPFSYRNEADEPAGLTVALCGRVADHVGAALGLPELRRVWVPVSSQTRFTAIRGQKIDLLCGPTTQTIQRRDEMDFSIPYFIDGAGAVFRRGGAERLSDLTTEPVGVLAGTTTERLAPKLLERVGATSEMRTFGSHGDGLQALQNGEIEAYFGDQSILFYQLGLMRPAVPLVMSEQQFSFEPYALAMRRGEHQLRIYVDDALSRIYESGEVFKIIQATMGQISLSKLTEAVYEVVTIPR
jgi:polar amino acid transport system substrate-binding protein/glutamate/aspartate transport system substrate-binding protein